MTLQVFNEIKTKAKLKMSVGSCNDVVITSV